MQIKSSAFENNGSIPRQYTCQGESLSPPLTINDVPVEVKSLALIMEDPDVPRSIRPDGMWDHWVIWNVDPKTVEILEGIEPKGVYGQTTSNTQKYVGPCPPDREHRYFFKLYALDAKLTLTPGSSKRQLVSAMQGHILTTATLIGRYKKF
ncbi:YbhB/YbcL family Raf kinase inhibitor-like protein [Candidatus Berkelbacteria bacterium]|nr:YbhB/YbcL family Raf kinase inhibitor-like protein [Candidatus Berkelbacteria bacterium]